MIKILLLALLTFAVIALSGCAYLKHRMADAPDKRNLKASIDSEVKKFTHGGPSQLLVVGVYKNGTAFIKGYGSANNAQSIVPDALTVFQIASVSKLLTASLLQLLCDEKLLDMDATLGELIGNSISLSPAAQRVTLRQLATHTSGFPRVPKQLERKVIERVGKKNLMQNPYGQLGPEHIFEYLKTTEDKRKPGRFEYSNFGMGLLGHVLEIVMQQEFESLVHEKLLAPLDMRDTAITLTPEMKMHLAQGHTGDGEASPLWTFSSLAGAGAFNSNAEDMMKFIRANIEDSAPLSRTLKKMHARQFDGNTGIGWMQPAFIDKFSGNQMAVWHNGMVGGYASYVSIDTEAKAGIVILSSKAVDVTMLGMMLTRQARTQSWPPQP